MGLPSAPVPGDRRRRWDRLGSPRPVTTEVGVGPGALGAVPVRNESDDAAPSGSTRLAVDRLVDYTTEQR